MKIITISREPGSGGRELGKCPADALGIPCYDQQIIEMIAQKKKLEFDGEQEENIMTDSKRKTLIKYVVPAMQFLLIFAALWYLIC